jgi:hypothetical protein
LIKAHEVNFFGLVVIDIIIKGRFIFLG